MQSKKALFIVLIVALVIFVVSLAVGRPLWQASVFSIGFLLIAAIVSSTGLLIPEGLIGRRLLGRHPIRKTPEATGKAEEEDKASFMERMELALDGLSRRATAEDARWITDYTRMMRGVGGLAYEVHDSVRSKDRAKQLAAFRKAVKQLPQFISEFETIPEPISREWWRTMKRQAQGMDLYLQGCSNFAEALEVSNSDLAGLAAKQINEALNLLDLMERPGATRGWR